MTAERKKANQERHEMLLNIFMIEKQDHLTSCFSSKMSHLLIPLLLHQLRHATTEGIPGVQTPALLLQRGKVYLLQANAKLPFGKEII